MSHWKGSKGELEVLSKIQPWWRAVEPEATFYRTPRSGGWAKGRRVPPGFQGHGDLMVDPSTCERFPFSIEVKWRNNVTLSSIARFAEGRDSPVWGFWEGACRDARLNGLVPMLWLRGANVLVGEKRRIRMEWRVAWLAMPGKIDLRLESEFLRLDPEIFL